MARNLKMDAGSLDLGPLPKDLGPLIDRVLEEMISDPKNPLLPSPAINGLTL